MSTEGPAEEASNAIIERFSQLYEGIFDNAKQLSGSNSSGVKEYSRKHHFRIEAPELGRRVFFIKEEARLPDGIPRFRIRIGRLEWDEIHRRIKSHHYEFKDDTQYRAANDAHTVQRLLHDAGPSSIAYVPQGTICYEPVGEPSTAAVTNAEEEEGTVSSLPSSFKLYLQDGPVCKATRSFENKEQVVCMEVEGTLDADGWRTRVRTWKETGEFLYGDKEYVLDRLG